jgi:hypothetical protein
VWVEVLDARLVRLLGRAGPLRPGPAVHEIVLADARELGVVRGNLRDARGQPAGSAELKRYDPLSHNQIAIPIDPGTGDFEARFPPGPFVLGCVVERRGLALGTLGLEPGGRLDLGRLTLPDTGTLVLLRGVRPGLEREPATFRLSARYGPDLFRELLRGPWPPPETCELFPGPHWIEVMAADGSVLLRASAEVRTGGEAWMDLP